MPSVLYKQEKSLKLLPYSHFHPNNYSIACNAGPVSNIWFCITFLAGYTAIVRVYTVTWVIPLGVVDNIKTTLTWLCPSQYSKEHPFSCTELEATQQAAKELVICTLSKSVCSKQNFYHSIITKLGFHIKKYEQHLLSTCHTTILHLKSVIACISSCVASYMSATCLTKLNSCLLFTTCCCKLQHKW